MLDKNILRIECTDTLIHRFVFCNSNNEFTIIDTEYFDELETFIISVLGKYLENRLGKSLYLIKNDNQELIGLRSLDGEIFVYEESYKRILKQDNKATQNKK